MMHQRMIGVGLAVALAVGLFSGVCGAQLSVNEILEKMPAQTPAEGEELSAALLQLGPAGVQELCAMLVPTSGGADVNVRFALDGMVKYVSRGATQAEQMMLAVSLVQALRASKETEVKAFLIEELRLIGGDESVGTLRQCLMDKALCDPAARAMVSIGTESATAALMGTLSSVLGAQRMSVVKALGELQYGPAAPVLLNDAVSDDADTRRVALFALANIGDPVGAEVLARAAEAADPYERVKGTTAYLLFGRRLNELGNSAEAEKVFRGLLTSRTAPADVNMQCAALSGLVATLGAGALNDLVAAMDSPEKEFRMCALAHAATLEGADATSAWLAKMKALKGEQRREVVAMLGKRGDKAALAAVLGELKAADVDMRLTAADAAVLLGGAEALPALLEAMAGAAEKDEVKALKAVVLRVPGDQVDGQVAAALAATPAAGRVALLQVLAERQADAQVEAVFAQSKEEDSDVRVAATKALAVLAGPQEMARLVELLVAARDDSERNAARDTVVAVGKQIEAADQRADAVLAALGTAQGAQRAALLSALPGLGGAKALDAVVADTASSDADVMDAAVRALANWPDAPALEPLFALAKGAEDLTYHVLALQGYVRLVGVSSAGAADKVKMYADALSVAKRPDEKKQALSGLGAVRTQEALNVVAKHLDDEALRTEALTAVAGIACGKDDNDKGMMTPEAAAVLEKALGLAGEGEVRGKIEKQLVLIAAGKEGNLAAGKAASASVDQQGDKAPALAVDGKVSLDSAWYGASYPCTYQVDLGAPAKVAAAQVFFYWDGARYYQYKVETSADGENWKVVADASGNTTPASPEGVLHTFAAEEAKFVRLNINKNSANEAVHLVELKVFGEGSVPKPAPAPAPPKPDAEGFVALFNGKDLTGWKGDTQGYVVEDGKIVCKPGGVLYTNKEYSDFAFRFDFKLTPGGNNGIGIRFPEGGHPSYDGMEIQVLDNTAEKYKDLHEYQYHGSVYGLVPAKRGYLKPVGEWNSEEIMADGRNIKVTLNGTVIVDANLDEAIKDGPMDGKEHAGATRTSGYIGFLGHGDVIEFRNIRVKELNK